MKYTTAALALIAANAAFTSQAVASECGKVTIADMNWNSASLIANIDRFILEHGYDCEAELIPGDTMPTGTSMIEKGQPDVAPELWSNSLKDALDKGVEEKRLRYAGRSLVDGGEEGFWVPSYLVKQYPEMKTIDGVIKHANLFEHPEDPEKSAFYSCPAGWNCQISAGNLFKALKLDNSGFVIVDPGSSAGLSGAIAKAYEREEPWFGYYWAPTAVLGKYDMVKVDFGSGVDEKEFIACTTNADCEAPKATMYPPSPVHTITTEAFATRAPDAYQYFTKRGFTNADMNQLLAWMEDNQADGEETMYYFLEDYPQIWTKWVSQDVANKVKSAL
ncbi:MULTISPECIES: ABC transporter substrate-binding protein [Vibrio]|uniref:ABC transporter substrate-binding protein n=1 Tax=Vibrio TaxID=662 RepID=UPI0001B94034|nr:MULTISPECIES: ABC transporter substrate-binding protein [Vibrio]EEX32471.1 putative periplasmic substrate-binding protein [Vibrio coralliilyticus ATCC BAA-450]MCM5508020.1 ABC transporter substrate-binding protein [Vibrio sp. SCSIO 43169]MDE3897570.1 ABC transporter substrate-binding protein [Vibrio sp. CC007]NRF13265.1 ABC transporter substrate-binding protein [Vibrio coralliilyticus]NRF61288.1 ABC transporter substrate-binding protein [Vibrio coralliilyticus]